MPEITPENQNTSRESIELNATVTAATGKITEAITSYDGFAVGHAGLYPVEEEAETNTEASVLNPIIKRGNIKGSKILLDVEDGVKTFINDILAKKHEHPFAKEDKQFTGLSEYGLSKNMERIKEIPDTMTGVLIHYLTKGIERDFGITWDETPASIRSKGDKDKNDAEKAREKGGRGLSKKEKNELLAKRNYPYWEKDINDGNITLEEAIIKMKEASDKVKEYEDAGYYLSPNKTQGVGLFDWKSAVIKAHNGEEDATKIYTRNKIAIVVPDIIENFYGNSKKTPKIRKEMGKSLLYFTEGVGDVLTLGTNAITEVYPIFSYIDAIQFIKERAKGGEALIKEIESNYSIVGLHLTKNTSSGMSKPRQVCIDCVSDKDGVQHLFLLDRDGGTTHLQPQKDWRNKDRTKQYKHEQQSSAS